MHAVIIVSIHMNSNVYTQNCTPAEHPLRAADRIRRAAIAPHRQSHESSRASRASQRRAAGAAAGAGTEAGTASAEGSRDVSESMFVSLTKDTRASSTVRTRCLDVAVKVATQSPGGADAIVEAGIVNSFIAELSRSNDVLAVLSTLELCGDLLGAEGICEKKALAIPLFEAIIKLASVGGDVHQRDVTIVSRAMTVLARTVAKSNFEDKHLVVTVLSSGLDPRVTENMGDAGQQLAEASASAFGELGLAESIDIVDMAMTTTVVAGRLSYIALAGGTNDIQINAMHALAAMIGADRPGRAILSEDAELKLKQAIIAAAACASPNTTVVDLLLSRLRGADSEKRISLYRFLAPMCCRMWFMLMVCENIEFVRRIIDVGAETGLNMQHWRHSVVISMKSTMDEIIELVPSGNGNGAHAETLSIASTLFSNAVRQGPLGTGHEIPSAPVVAMDMG